MFEILLLFQKVYSFAVFIVIVVVVVVRNGCWVSES